MSKRLNKCLVEFQESRTRRGSDHAVAKSDKSGWRSARELGEADLDNTREVFKKSLHKTFLHHWPDHRRDSDLQSIPGSCESERQKRLSREAHRQQHSSHTDQFHQHMHFLRNRKHPDGLPKQAQKSPPPRAVLAPGAKLLFADPGAQPFHKSGSLVEQLRHHLKKSSSQFRESTFRFERGHGLAGKAPSKLLVHFREQKLQPCFKPPKMEEPKPSGRSPMPRTMVSSLLKPKYNASLTHAKSSPDTAQIFRTQIHSIIKYNASPHNHDRGSEKEKTKKVIQRMIQNLGVK